MSNLRCMHCRSAIQVNRNPLVMPFVHLGGMYSCPLHPETLAEPADLRWEDIEGQVFTEQTGSLLYTVFRLSLRTRNDTLSFTFRAPPEDIADTQFDAYGEILNEMVKRIDKELDKMGAE